MCDTQIWHGEAMAPTPIPDLPTLTEPTTQLRPWARHGFEQEGLLRNWDTYDGRIGTVPD